MPKRSAPKGCFWRGKTLWGRAEIKGRDIKWSLRTDDPEIAKRRRKAEFDRQVAAAHYGDHRRMFAEVMAEWAEQIGRQVGARTAARYATSLKQLQPFLEGVYDDEIDGTMVADIIAKRQAHGVSNATIKRDLGAVSSVLNFGIDRGYRESNPVLPRLKRLKERRDPIILPDPHHVELLIARAPGMLAAMIRAYRATGARRDELVYARRSQLDHTRKQLTIVGKGNKLRVIDLADWGYEEIFKPLPAALGSAFMFWHHQGEPFRTLSGQFRVLVASVAKSAQKSEQDFRPFRLHDLRHLHAVEWLKSGRSIYDLQQRLGHTSVKTTEIYLRYLTPEEARIAMQAGTKTGT